MAQPGRIAGIAGAVAFGVFFAVWFLVPKGMGFGDVRLAGAIGVTVGYLSLLHAYVAFLAGFLLGMVFGLALMVVASGRKTRIPFAPCPRRRGGDRGVFWVASASRPPSAGLSSRRRHPWLPGPVGR